MSFFRMAVVGHHSCHDYKYPGDRQEWGRGWFDALMVSIYRSDEASSLHRRCYGRSVYRLREIIVINFCVPSD